MSILVLSQRLDSEPTAYPCGLVLNILGHPSLVVMLFISILMKQAGMCSEVYARRLPAPERRMLCVVA
jgi:hypothetical protein